MIHAELDQTVFAARRQALLNQLPENSAVVLYAAPEAERNGDVTYPYRPNSYFWYFTGFPEPNAIAVISRDGYCLYNQVRDPVMEIWNGVIIGQENAIVNYGADTAFAITEAETLLPKQLSDFTHLYTVLGTHQANDVRMMNLIQAIHHAAGRGGAPIEGVFDVRRIVDEMRLVKTPEEQALLHTAGKITAAGHRAAMLAALHSQYEYQVQAELEAEFRRHGCHWSFGSIVASGANACCLHYHQNNQPLKDGKLLLVDAGAEYAGYAGDITRTFPINGRFSAQQRELYQIVLSAQKMAIGAARAGISHEQLHKLTATALMQGLIDAEIIKGDAAALVESGDCKQYYPHGTGHWLGLDVHDVGVYKVDGQSRCYTPGMVITIEPGLYLQPDDQSLAPEWRGIGIRIEDDVIITDREAEVTTSEVPKEIDDIEHFMKG